MLCWNKVHFSFSEVPHAKINPNGALSYRAIVFMIHTTDNVFPQLTSCFTLYLMGVGEIDTA